MWSLLALKKHPSDEFVSSDPCVPISNLAKIVTRSQELLEESGMLGSILGHVGDGEKLSDVVFVGRNLLTYRRQYPCKCALQPAR